MVGMAIVMGFDVSSTCIGYCVLEVNEKLVRLRHASYLKPSKEGHIIDRLADTRNKIRDLIQEHNPDHIGIEEVIQFMKGKSTAKTITTLTAFNRMIGLLAYDHLGRAPKMFHVASIRHGLKKGKVLPAKEDMPKLVAKHLKIKFPWEYIVKGKNKGKPKVSNYDMADGIAVALYYAHLLTGKIKRK